MPGAVHKKGHQADYDRAFVELLAQERLGELATRTVIARGTEYHAGGRVHELDRVAVDRYQAYVAGTYTYTVTVTVALHPKAARFHCECRAFESQLCKHVVAVAAAIRAALGAPDEALPLAEHEIEWLRQYAVAPAELAAFEAIPGCAKQLSLPLSVRLPQKRVPEALTVRECLVAPEAIARRGLLSFGDLIRVVRHEVDALREIAEDAREEAEAREREARIERQLALAKAQSTEARRFVELAAARLAVLHAEASQYSAYWLERGRSADAKIASARPPLLTIDKAQLRLDSWRQGRLELTIDAYAEDRRVPLWIALLERAIQALAEPTHPLHQAVKGGVERDEQAAILGGLDDLLLVPPPESRPPAIVSWRFRFVEGRVALEAYVHKPNSKGGYSAGARMWSREDSRAALLPEDELAFARQGSACKQLEALAGHPRVFAAEAPTTPVTVRRGRIAMRVIEVDEAHVQLLACLGDVPLTSLADGDAAVAFDREKHTLYFAELDAFEAQLVRHLLSAPAILPLAEKQALLERVVALEQRVLVGLSPALRGAFREPTPELVARFSGAHSGGMALQVLVEPLGAGIGFVPGEGQHEISRVIDGERCYTVREPDKERALADALWQSLGLPETPGYETPRLDSEAMLDVLGALKASGVRVEWPKQLPRPQIATMSEMSQLKLQVKKQRGWFELDGAVVVDGEKIAVAKLALALRERKKYVALDDGKWLTVEAGLRQNLAALESLAATSKDGTTLTLAGAAALAELEDHGAECEGDAELTAMVQRIRDAAERVHALPERLNADLRPYQVDGFQWLARLSDWRIGGCLADDMGLGKTVQAIALLLHRVDAGPALVVAPTSVGFNWQRELARFAPSLRAIDYRDGLPKALHSGEVVIVSYTMMAKDIEALAATAWGTLVFDEAHALKNPEALRTRAARQLRAELCVALTGTPIENRLSELWSLFRVIAPGLLGDAETFRERFVAPIELRRDPHARQLLGRIVGPFILRRTKAVVAPELPPKTEIPVPVELEEEELAVYHALREAKLLALKSKRNDVTGQRARIAVLAALTELRLAACHPSLADETSTLEGSKLAEITRLVADLKENGHRALLFSQFTSFLDVIEARLHARSVATQRLDGSTPHKERARRVDAFERGEGDVFLLSLQAAGTGLNLTSADYVIIVDPWWNPAVEDQAIGRAHRIGQTKPVTVYRLYCRGTLEEKILEMHVDKRELVAAVMDNASTAPKSISGAELWQLLEEDR